MITVRKSKERGFAEHGWLTSYHTFSFADYYDPQFMNFRVLRVINEDWVKGGEGFGTHPHKDMEIITYVLSGALEHKDSLGTGSVINPHDLQMMCAGSGIRHSEFNHSPKETVHLLQIWIMPNKNNLKPGYQQKTFSQKEKEGKFCLLASPDARQGSLKINQDVDLYAAILKKDSPLDFSFRKNRYGFIQVADGEMNVNHISLKRGDGVMINDENKIQLSTKSSTEILLFDLP